MAEKRNIDRHRKRFSLSFGAGESVCRAFTEDISATGLFIKTAYVSSPGSVIFVELALDDKRTVRLDARVMWAKRISPQMIYAARKGGMGIKIIRFVSGESYYRDFCEELSLPYAELL